MIRHKYSWEEETLIIELYTRTPTSEINNHNPEIMELTDFLKSNGYDCVMTGIRNKMENLKSIDEEYTSKGRVGRTHIGAEFKQRWLDYCGNGFCNIDSDVEKARKIISGHVPSKEPTQYRYQQRDGQSLFRTRVLVAYDNACCISGMKEKSLLQACHVKPYHVCKESGHMEQTMDVRNGLCMNVLYHNAFDKGLISIDEDLRLMLSPSLNVLDDDRFFKPFEGKRIRQPIHSGIDDIYLKYHRDTIFLKS